MKAAPLVLLLALAFIALSAAPAVRASIGDPLHVTLVSWGGEFNFNTLQMTVPWVNMTLTYTAHAGDFIVVIVQGDWENAKRSMTPTDNGGSSYSLAESVEITQTDFYMGTHKVGLFVFYATARGDTTMISIHNNTIPGNRQMAQFETAAIYTNASGIGAVSYINGSYSYANHNSTLFTTQANSVIMFFATMAWGNYAYDTCVNSPSSFTEVRTRGAGGYSDVVGNANIVGHDQLGIYDACYYNTMGAHASDSNGPLSSPKTTRYTYTWSNYYYGSAWRAQLVEVKAALEPVPNFLPQAMAAFWIVLFFVVCGLIVGAAWMVRRRLH
jgi:hypothetical protein